MSRDIHLAFAHPSERSRETGATHLDRISLRDHVVAAEIGAFQAERGTTQRLNFNIVVEVTPVERPIDDDVDRILSYDKVTDAIADELASERLNLLETLAERVAERILAEPQAVRAFVRIEKLDRGPGALGVEIVRDGSDLAAARAREEPVHPLVVFLGNDAIASGRLTRWLDGIETAGVPVILCVGPAAVSAPASAATLAQRRIDLLAIEQNAWVLAGRDRRCVVVDTLTELEWGMRNGQISVWAPSKVVLDAAEGPSASPRDAGALVTWFAGLMSAREVVAVGDVPVAAGARAVAAEADGLL